MATLEMATEIVCCSMLAGMALLFHVLDHMQPSERIKKWPYPSICIATFVGLGFAALSAGQGAHSPLLANLGFGLAYLFWMLALAWSFNALFAHGQNQKAATKFAAVSVLLILLFSVAVSVTALFHRDKVASLQGPMQVSSAPVAPNIDASSLRIINVVGAHVRNNDTHRRGFFLNLFYENIGNLPVVAMAHRTALLEEDHILTSDEVARNMAWVLVSGPTPNAKLWQPEIQPGSRPEHYFSVPEKDEELEKMEPIARNVEKNKERLYLFTGMKYLDSNVPSGQMRVTEFCAWFLGTFEMWHDCGTRTYTSTK